MRRLRLLAMTMTIGVLLTVSIGQLAAGEVVYPKDETQHSEQRVLIITSRWPHKDFNFVVPSGWFVVSMDTVTAGDRIHIVVVLEKARR